MSVFDKALENKWLKAKKAGPADADGIIQKRDHFRLPCNFLTDFKLLETDESGNVTPGIPNPGCISNLSGGGLKLQADLVMKEEDRILITLTIDDSPIHLVGEVRVKYDTPNASYPYQYGIVFKGISDADQDKIFRYLFREQPNRAIM